MFFLPYPLSVSKVNAVWAQAVSDWDISVFDSEGGAETTMNCYIFLLPMLFFGIYFLKQ